MKTDRTKRPANFNTPVALFVFNRPSATALLIEKLRALKPETLYVICDGPRKGREDDIESRSRTLALFDNLPWKCDIRFIVSEVNLGCRERITSGIDRVFESEAWAIFLEDDCLPDLEFFYFCQAMLEKYQSASNVGMVSGIRHTLLPHLFTPKAGFTKVPRIWGWATWKDRWNGFDPTLPGVSQEDRRLAANWGASNPFSRHHWQERFLASSLDPSVWDAQWVYALWSRRLFSVQPPRNLVRNIGFGDDATHTKGQSSLFNSWPSYSVTWPIIIPGDVREGRFVALWDSLPIRIEGYLGALAEKGLVGKIARYLFLLLQKMR